MIWFLATATALAQAMPGSFDFDAPPADKEAGWVEVDVDPHAHGVVNGERTSDYSQVGLVAAVFDDGSVAPFCSGSLVTSDIVLTAAHCIEGADDFAYDPDLAGFVFAMGADIFSGLADYRWIVGGELHPDYNRATIAWDLGLLQLDSPVSGVDPLCLNDDAIDSDWYGLEVNYVGWGMTSMESPMDGYKRTVDIPMVDHDDTHFFTYIDDKNICHGDSGGGAIVELVDGTRMLTGVNSYGLDVETGEYYGCDVDGAGAAAARVDTALDWIQSYTGTITCTSDAPAACPDGTDWDGEDCIDRETSGATPSAGRGSGSGGAGPLDIKLACSSAGDRGLRGGLALGLLSFIGLLRRRQTR